jgi:hypothetical protein
MIGVEGSDKGEYVLNNILSSYKNIKEVEFYDDSKPNIEDMNRIKKQIQKEDPSFKFDIYLVSDGVPELS